MNPNRIVRLSILLKQPVFLYLCILYPFPLEALTSTTSIEPHHPYEGGMHLMKSTAGPSNPINPNRIVWKEVGLTPFQPTFLETNPPPPTIASTPPSTLPSVTPPLATSLQLFSVRSKPGNQQRAKLPFGVKQKCTYTWYPSPVDWCLGEVRKLAAGGGHSAVLTDVCSLKELCEFQIADSVTPWNASMIEDVAYRTGSDALVRLCERLREDHSDGGTCKC
ncbi:unnamed protein product [Lactuca virosa]|uniref:Uncharacterized protein n=1 Tax=Lactuca virosa TaxID=75947 RepID=A0AAU9MKK7_9ASTR|nr:unnamed protein product [Lactuca virosa]